jgi:hypothetical protein
MQQARCGGMEAAVEALVSSAGGRSGSCSGSRLGVGARLALACWWRAGYCESVQAAAGTGGALPVSAPAAASCWEVWRLEQGACCPALLGLVGEPIECIDQGGSLGCCPQGGQHRCDLQSSVQAAAGMGGEPQGDAPTVRCRGDDRRQGRAACSAAPLYHQCMATENCTCVLAGAAGGSGGPWGIEDDRGCRKGNARPGHDLEWLHASYAGTAAGCSHLGSSLRRNYRWGSCHTGLVAAVGSR